MTDRSEVLFVGGRSGVGKTRVALELHERLAARGVKHAVIEGDNLDLAYPPVGEHGLAEKNLATLWKNFRTLGYHRLIYTNTLSVVYSAGSADAMGDNPVVKGVLLCASDDHTATRLERRETATTLELYLGKSRLRAAELEKKTPAWVWRVDTGGKDVPTVAGEILERLRWT